MRLNLLYLHHIYKRTALCILCTVASSHAAAQGVHWPDIYTVQQAEDLQDSARQQLIEGNPRAAELDYSTALQAIKVNYGLVSPLLLPPLQGLIESQFAQGDWDRAERQIEYFRWLNAQLYREDFQAYLQGMAALSQLLLATSADVNNPSSIRYLIASKNLNWMAASAIENRLGENSVELAPWLYKIALTHYYQSTLIKRRGISSYTYKSDGEDIVSGWSIGRNESMRISYNVGRELLQRIEEIYTSAGDRVAPEARALAKVYQGDWELLFGSEALALDFYTSAWEAMQLAGLSTSEADNFFNRPISLPATRLVSSWQSGLSLAEDSQKEAAENQIVRFHAWSPLYPTTPEPVSTSSFSAEESTTFTARASFNLVPASADDENGEDFDPGLENLRILSASPDNDMVKERALFEISLLKFRPKLLGGMPVSLENIELEYLFSPQQDLMSLIEN